MRTQNDIHCQSNCLNLRPFSHMASLYGQWSAYASRPATGTESISAQIPHNKTSTKSSNLMPGSLSLDRLSSQPSSAATGLPLAMTSALSRLRSTDLIADEQQFHWLPINGNHCSMVRQISPTRDIMSSDLPSLFTSNTHNVKQWKQRLGLKIQSLNKSMVWQILNWLNLNFLSLQMGFNWVSCYRSLKRLAMGGLA